jgi:GcrA cell cycle regulator
VPRQRKPRVAQTFNIQRAASLRSNLPASKLQGNTALAMPAHDYEPEPEPIEIIIPMAQRCTLIELDDSTSAPEKCRWPVGDPGQPDFFFCGGKATSGLPYCVCHSRIAYTPVADRRRAKRPVAPGYRDAEPRFATAVA